MRNPFQGLPVQNNAFVDRPGIMDKLNAALHRSTGGCKIVALNGLGGMGKSQLMLRYCYVHLPEYKYVFWLNIEDQAAAVDSFAKLAINLGLDEESVKQLEKEGRTIEWVCSWLEKQTGWLLLLDNADDVMVRAIFKKLPRLGGSIILSTREPVRRENAIVISVDKMEEEEAISLLLDVPPNNLADQESTLLNEAKEVVLEVDCMPLAVDLARAYVENTQTTFRQYLAAF